MWDVYRIQCLHSTQEVRTSTEIGTIYVRRDPYVWNAGSCILAGRYGVYHIKSGASATAEVRLTAILCVPDFSGSIGIDSVGALETATRLRQMDF